MAERRWSTTSGHRVRSNALLRFAFQRTTVMGSQAPKRPKQKEIGHERVTAKKIRATKNPRPAHEPRRPVGDTFSMPAPARRSARRLAFSLGTAGFGDSQKDHQIRKNPVPAVTPRRADIIARPAARRRHNLP